MEVLRHQNVVRFGAYELRLSTKEVFKNGLRTKLPPQAFQVLQILVERRGQLVSREELHLALWPADTFVDFDHGLNNAIKRIRDLLSDSAEKPRFIETLPRLGYRFIGQVDEAEAPPITPRQLQIETETPKKPAVLTYSLAAAAALLLVAAFIFSMKGHPVAPPQQALTRVTFDEGLQFGVTWSPDSRFIAYSSNREGKFDIWVRQLSGGDAVRVTKARGNNWQPDWSPDGKHIVYRSEDGGGGLYIVPALGGEGLERKITNFGFYPRWSPDGSQILFQTTQIGNTAANFYVITLDGSQPREVATGFTVHGVATSAAWHPDGKRITIWVWETSSTPIPDFWTVPIAGGRAIKSEIRPEILRMGEIIAGEGFSRWADFDFKFSWAPSGDAIYFERKIRMARNIWRMKIDPRTLQPTALERITTGPGEDSEFSLSPDGSKVAFSGESHDIRVWLFPFDGVRGQVSGAGEPITPAGEEAWVPTLSRDGKKLAFCGKQSGRWELRLTALSDGRETRILADDPYTRAFPQWAPDGSRVVYAREATSTHEIQLMMWSSQKGAEEPLAKPTHLFQLPFDWSSDGNALLISQTNLSTGRDEIWRLSLSDGPHAETSAQQIVADPINDLYQAHFSPDGQYIVFEATQGPESILYVMPSGGGSRIRVSQGDHWDDKPRWSPDGKSIYFLSQRDGFFNVWGIRFDPIKGKPLGKAFPVTSFSSYNHMIPTTIPTVEMSLTRDKLVVTMEERSGSIWVLDNLAP